MVLWGREGPASGWTDHYVLRSQVVFKKSWWFLSFAAKTPGELESFFTHQGFWCLLGWVCVCVCVCVCVYCMCLGEHVPVWLCWVLPTKLACQGLLLLWCVLRRAHSNSQLGPGSLWRLLMPSTVTFQFLRKFLYWPECLIRTSHFLNVFGIWETYSVMHYMYMCA